MSRLTIRCRIALAAALVMGIALTLMGTFVFVRVERSLTDSVNRDLEAQLAEIRAHAQRNQGQLEPSVDPETHVLSQLLDGSGRPIHANGLSLQRALISVSPGHDPAPRSRTAITSSS